MGFRLSQPSLRSGVLLLTFPVPDLPAGVADALVWDGLEGATGGKDIPWGVFLTQPKIEEVAQLKEKGCDFIILGPSAPAEILRDEAPGRWLTIEPGLSSDLARALNSLPVEGIVLSLEVAPLSIQQLLQVHSLSVLLQKPLLARVSPQLDMAALPALVEAGVRGVMVKAKPPQLKRWHQTLSSLTPPRLPGEAVLPPLEEPR